MANQLETHWQRYAYDANCQVRDFCGSFYSEFPEDSLFFVIVKLENMA